MRSESETAPAINPAPARSPERLHWIDMAKGVGILAVVVGHVWTRGAVRDAMYAFHMPFFFLLSGYLFSPRPAGPFARRQLALQGTSYVAFLLLVLAMDIMIEQAKGHRPIFHDWPADLWPLLLGGSELRGPFTVFWFVPCLLIARMLFNALGGRFPDPLAPVWVGIAGLCLLVAHFAGAATDFSPLGVLSVPMALVLLWAGAALRALSSARGLGWRAWMGWLLVPLAIAALALFPTLNMKAGDYGWPVASVAGAVAISALIFQAVRVLPVPRAIGRGLEALGQASLVVMYLHVPVIHYLSPYLGKGVLLALGVVVPLVAYRLLTMSAATRRIFLGQG